MRSMLTQHTKPRRNNEEPDMRTFFLFATTIITSPIILLGFMCRIGWQAFDGGMKNGEKFTKYISKA